MNFKSTVKNSLYSLKIIFSFAPFIASLYTILSFVGAAFTTLQVVVLKHLVDSVISMTGVGMNRVLLWGGLYVGTMVLSQIYTFSLGKLGRLLYKKLIKTLTPQIISKFRKIHYYYFEDEEFQNVMSRMTSNPQQMVHNTFFSVISCINSLLKLFGMLGVFFSASFFVGLASLLIGVPMTVLELRSTDKQQLSIKEDTVDKRKRKYIQSLFTNKNSVYEIKLFNAKDYLIDKWSSVNKNIFKRQKNITISFIRAHSFVLLLKVLYVILNITLLTYYLEVSYISLGTFVSLVSSFGSLFSILSNASYSLSVLYKRTFEINYYKEFLEFSENPNYSNDIMINNYNIVFDNVRFTYPGTKKEVLRGVNFEINTNERVALVGLNGTGKSTIIKLLCGLYSPDSGTILIGGQDIACFSPSELHKFCSVAFQDFVSYELTLRENVAIGNIKVLNDDERIKSALKEVGLSGLAERGLDINLGRLLEDSTDLSKGQWQRIAIARALISDSAFIVLDEPTASLDPIAESKMYESFSGIMRDRGSIIVTHRLASAKFVDKIIVIDNGVVVEVGCHSELVTKNGLYSTLFREQQSWYIDGKKSNERDEEK